MSNWDNLYFAPQGWQCPICKRVYSLTTPMCYYCGNSVTVSGTTVGDSLIDRIQHEFVTQASHLEWLYGEGKGDTE